MSQKIIDAVMRLTGRPFAPARTQNFAPLNGVTEDQVIENLTVQFRQLQEAVAASFNALEPQDVPLHGLAHLLKLDRLVGGISAGNHGYTKRLYWPFHVELGEIVGRKLAVAEIGPGFELYAPINGVYLDVFGPDRPVDPEGFVFYMLLIRQGRFALNDLPDELRSSDEFKRLHKREVR